MTTATSLPPGPAGQSPVISLQNMVSFAQDPFCFMQHLNQTYGGIAAIQGLFKLVFIFDPEYNRQVLSNPDLFYSAGDTKESAPLRIPPNSSLSRITSGLNLLNGENHHAQRRLMLPALHRKSVATYYEAIVDLTERQLSSWRTGQVRDILFEMRQLTSAIAVKTLFGLDPSTDGERVRILMESWEKLFFSLSTQIQLNLPGLPYHKLLELSENLEVEFRALVKTRKGLGLGNDILSLLIQASDDDGAKLSDEQLIGEISTLFNAGHETTASALTWTLFLLEQHPAILADLIAELKARLQGNSPTLEDLAHLPLLDSVIKESMRLLPPGIFFMRYSTAPVQIGGYKLPAKTNIVYSPAVTHRNPELYPQADCFIPSRWENLSPSPYQYLPFSGGPRMCLGATFAQTEIKIVLATLLQRFRLVLPPAIRVDRSGLVISVPKKGLPMQLYSLNFNSKKNAVTGNIHKAVNLK